MTNDSGLPLPGRKAEYAVFENDGIEWSCMVQTDNHQEALELYQTLRRTNEPARGWWQGDLFLCKVIFSVNGEEPGDKIVEPLLERKEKEINAGLRGTGA
jgi:hypothetical protein